ncbi:MAG: YIP1 family protein [Halobacteriota archaeon]
MTTWVENPHGGRERGPRGLVRAWVEVLVRPRRFFRVGVAPGDQAPGLVFGVLVALWYVGGLFAFDPGSIPAIPGGVVLGLLAVGLLVAPATLHLLAALQTILLVPLVPDRAGVSETVQVIAYATAPCVFASVPEPAVGLACALYGATLLVVGVSTVHETSPWRALAATALPSLLLFGYGFDGFGALAALAADVTAAIGVI